MSREKMAWKLTTLLQRNYWQLSLSVIYNKIRKISVTVQFSANLKLSHLITLYKEINTPRHMESYSKKMNQSVQSFFFIQVFVLTILLSLIISIKILYGNWLILKDIWCSIWWKSVEGFKFHSNLIFLNIYPFLYSK